MRIQRRREWFLRRIALLGLALVLIAFVGVWAESPATLSSPEFFEFQQTGQMAWAVGQAMGLAATAVESSERTEFFPINSRIPGVTVR